MLADNAYIENASDIVAHNVTALPADPRENALVYLTQDDGGNAPGLYIYTEAGGWVFISNGEEVA